ncbi:MAG: RagB/SusD family nutrient uptake outer membrane protein [Balneolaceae bacterium]
MKKLLAIILAVPLFFAVQSCEDFLDKIPEADGLVEEDVFTDYLNFKRFLDRGYTWHHDYLNQFNQSMLAAITDEGYTRSEWETMTIIGPGNWTSGFGAGGATEWNTFEDAWLGIRVANMALKNLPLLEESGGTSAQIDELKGQAHFLRAWYYFDLFKRHGGMPYIEEVLEPDSEFNLPRLSYLETAQKIAADADTAAGLLPEQWPQSDIGRANVGAALAIKSTALLYAASPGPYRNTSNDVALWEAAAQAAWDFIDYAETTGHYELMDGTSTEDARWWTPGGEVTHTYPDDRVNVFMYTEPQDNTEIIYWHHQSLFQNKYVTFGVPSITSRGRMSGYSPTQNFVDRFEMLDGYPIDESPMYDPADPYANRDPRFYQTILFNMRDWNEGAGGDDVYLQLYNGGRDRIAEQYYSYTGYLSNKYWDRNSNVTVDQNPPITYTIYFRYADILLQYAEAANEVGGPNHTIAGATMSAADAVNMVRARVDMPPIPPEYMNQDDFRERVKNERAIELFFENKRIFDLQRWGDLTNTENTVLYGATITENTGSPIGYDVQQSTDPVVIRPYVDRHYLFPVPPIQASMYEAFDQNPGW